MGGLAQLFHEYRRSALPEAIVAHLEPKSLRNVIVSNNVGDVSVSEDDCERWFKHQQRTLKMVVEKRG